MTLLSREQALEHVLRQLHNDDLIVSSTGKLSRELYELDDRPERGFLNVGAMGCAAAIGLGIALNTLKRVFILDGDGAVLMQMGTLATIGWYKPENLFHIVFDNQAYDSTGGHKSATVETSLTMVAIGCGYRGHQVKFVGTKEGIHHWFEGLAEGPAMMVIPIRKGCRNNLKRPDELIERKKKFMEALCK